MEMSKTKQITKDKNDYADDWVFDEILTDNEDTEEDFVIYKSIKGKRLEDESNLSNENKYDNNNPASTLSDKESFYLSSLLQYHWFLSDTESTLEFVNELFECNISGNELREYYLDRPQLFDYTFNTELSRMDYTVKDGGNFLRKTYTNKESIFGKFSERNNQYKIFRAANQSLLADVMQVLSIGKENVIRPQYLASAVAESCHFLVDLKMNSVFCDCSLVISLVGSQFRLEIATLNVEIYFVLNDNEEDGTELFVQAVDLTPKPVSGDKFLSVAKILASDDAVAALEEQQGCDSYHSDHSDADSSKASYRDALVYSSLFVNKTMNGVSNAWRQVESVAPNVTSTLKLFSGLVLPSNDLLSAIAQEEEEFVKNEIIANEDQEETMHFNAPEDDNDENETTSCFNDEKLSSSVDRAQIVSYAACTKEHKQLLIEEEKDEAFGSNDSWRQPLIVRF